MERLVREKDAAGGQLIIEFRKDDIFGDPTHQKNCSFFLDPNSTDASSATIWTASHCLDIARDGKYRLKFYVDSATGYSEIPVEFDQLKSFENLRSKIGVLSNDLQREILLAFKPTDVDFSRSKNGTDICLNNFGTGWSKFHEPIPGNNQIACFLYHDLALVSFKFPKTLNSAQKNLTDSMLKKAISFDKSSVTYPNASISNNGVTVTMTEFKKNWVDIYKQYTKLRSLSGLALFAQKTLASCGQKTDSKQPAICENIEGIKTALQDSGFTEHAQLLTADGLSAYNNELNSLTPKIPELWQFYKKGTVNVDGNTVPQFKEFNILSNYTWNGGQQNSFSAIPLMGFVGLGWGSTTDRWSGDVRERVGVATYHWIPEGTEHFIYAILPKQQTQLNLNKGYGQLRLTPGDSGTLVLADGLPMAVLTTVDGEKTSGGSSVLPLPEINDDAESGVVPDVSPSGASAEAVVVRGNSISAKNFCLN